MSLVCSWNVLLEPRTINIIAENILEVFQDVKE